MPNHVFSPRSEAGLALPFVVRNGLYVPSWYATTAEGDDGFDGRWFTQFTVTTIGWNEAVPNGEPATLEGVIKRLKRYSLLQLSMMVGRVSIALQQQRSTTPRTIQDQLIDNHLGAGVAAMLHRNVAASLGDNYEPEHIAFFHEQQLLNALKLGFLCIDQDVLKTNEPAQAFVEALLMLSDLIGANEGDPAATVEDKRANLELQMFANTLFNQSAGGLHDVVRTYSLFVAPDAKVIAAPGMANIPEMLERATGFPPRIAFSLLFAISSDWLTKSNEDLSRGRIAQNKSQYLSTLKELTATEIRKAYAMTSWDGKDLRLEIEARYAGGDQSIGPLRTYDFLPIEQRPLVSFGDVAICASIPLLQRLSTSSLQHRFLNNTLFTAAEREAFLRTRGKLFERYVLDALARAFGSRLLTESDLPGLPPGSKVCDGIVVYEDSVILIEAKAAMVRLDTRNTESYEQYRRTLGTATRDAADQLESTIELIGNGAFRELGIKATAGREVYPVVVLFDQVLPPLTYRSVRETDLAGHPLLIRIEKGLSAPIQLLNVRELELLEIAAESGNNVRDLLRSKLAREDTREISFHHYCHLRNARFLDNRGTWYEERFVEIMAVVRQSLFSLGLKSTAET